MFGTKTKAQKTTNKQQQPSETAQRTAAMQRQNDVAAKEISESEKRQERPGIFKRFWNWLTGLFSRKKNTETASGGDAAESYADTMVSAQQEIQNVSSHTDTQTLAPQITDAGVNDNVQPSVEQDAVDLAAEQPEAESGTVNIGGIIFVLESDNKTAKSGTIKVAGSDVAWTSESGVIVEGEGKTQTASGKISFSKNGLFDFKNIDMSSAGDSVNLSSSDSAETEITSGDLKMKVDTISMSKEGALSGKGVTVINKQVNDCDTDGHFADADVTIADNIIIANAEKKVVSNIEMPFIVKNKDNTYLAISEQDGKLDYGIVLKAADISVGKEKIAEIYVLDKPDIFMSANESGTVTFKMPQTTYTLRICNGKFSKDIQKIPDAAFELGAEKPVVALTTDEMALSSFKFNQLAIAIDGKNKTIDLKADSIQNESGALKSEPIHISINDNGFMIDAFKFNYEDEAIKGVAFDMKDFGYDKDAKLTFSEASASVSSISKESFEITDAVAKLSNTNDYYGLSVSAKAKVNTEDKLITFDTDVMDIGLDYVKSKQNSATLFGNFTGYIKGEKKEMAINIGDEPAVETEIGDILFSNNGFVLTTLDSYINIDNEKVKFKAQGAMHGRNIVLSKAGVQSEFFNMFLQDVKFGDTLLFNSMSMEYQDNKWHIVAEHEKLPNIEFPVMGTTVSFSDYQPAVDIDAGGKTHIGFEEASFSVSNDYFNITGDKVKYIPGSPLEADEVSISSPKISEGFSSVVPDSEIKLSLGGVKIAEDSFKAESISVVVDKEFEILGLKVSSFETGANINEQGKFDSFFGSVTLTYDRPNNIISKVSGGLVLTFADKAGNGSIVPRITGCKDLEFTIKGYGTGKVSKLTETEDGFEIEEITLEKDESEESDDSQKGFREKFIAAMPKMQFAAEDVLYKKATGFEVDPTKIKVKKIEKEFKFNDNIGGKIGYSSDEGFEADLKATVCTPSARKKETQKPVKERSKKTLFNPKITVPTPIPFLSISGGFYVDIGADAMGEFIGKYNPNKKTIYAGVNGAASANAGAGLEADVTVGVGAYGLSAGLKGGVNAAAEGTVSGGVTLLSHPERKKQKHWLTVDKANTKVEYTMSALLDFALSVGAGVKIPQIFVVESKSLYKEWELLTIPLGKVAMNGSVAYQDGKYRFNADFDAASMMTLFNNTKFEKLTDPTFSNEMTDKVNEIDASSKAVYEALEKYPDCMGLGAVKNAIVAKQALVITEKIDTTMKNSSENAKKLFDKIKEIRANTATYIKSDNVGIMKYGRANEVFDQSQLALDIMGGSTKAEDETQKAISSKDMYAKVSTMLSEDSAVKKDAEKKISKLDELARLDPIAVYNMFKIYKSIDGQNWESYFKRAQELSRAMQHKNELRDDKIVLETESDKKAHSVLTNASGQIYKMLSPDTKEIESKLMAVNSCMAKRDDIVKQIEKLNEEKRAGSSDEKKLNKKLEALEKEKAKSDENLEKAKEEHKQVLEKMNIDKYSTLGKYTELIKDNTKYGQANFSKKVQSYKQTYDGGLNVSEENVANNKVFLRDFLTHISKDKLSSKETEQQSQVDKRFKNLQERDKLDWKVMRDDIGFKKNDSLNARKEESTGRVDKLMKAHDNYIEKVVRFGELFHEAQAHLSAIVGKKDKFTSFSNTEVNTEENTFLKEQGEFISDNLSDEVLKVTEITQNDIDAVENDELLKVEET